LQEGLIESELFGGGKGAKRGTAGKIGKIGLSNCGTLFLDEIEELPPRVQARLLQAMAERSSEAKKIKPDFRLIAASNRDLEEEARNGRFRSDLFYSLNALRLRVPPLRERVEDIAPMALRFLGRFCREYGKSVSMSPRFLNFLERYGWPGNVRELESLMERLVITTADPVLDVTHLPGEYAGKRVRDAEPLDGGGTLSERVEAFEGRIVREAYGRLGTTVAVARELGISQATAARKVARYVRDGAPRA
jgi:transcriptional regulator with PAS, ATPase and Fis domain